MTFDVFISHASEDKDDFVRELAERLQERRIEVWYDEHSLQLGDSLRQSIDFGLSKSRFGIVVLSKNFFNKRWTNWELNGLVQREINSPNNLIIPIWHNIEKEDIIQYSPSLADKLAIKSTIGIPKIIDKIDRVINPEGSTLIVAREYLISKGFNPPILTDDWWLDVLEYPGVTVLENDYLKFSISWLGAEPLKRGKYIGQIALQMSWRQNAEWFDISQLSHPDDVASFIESQPGLKEFCIEQPLKAALYFPQLTIKGMGHFMEEIFSELFSLGNGDGRRTCPDELVLRDETSGKSRATKIASFYFTGDGGGVGPSTGLYNHIDYLIWLLSASSQWLPRHIQSTLFTGLCNWAVWNWSHIDYEEYDNNKNTGKLQTYLFRLRDNPQLPMPLAAKQDLLSRIQVSIEVLNLPETKEVLVKRFLDEGIISAWVDAR